MFQVKKEGSKQNILVSDFRTLFARQISLFLSFRSLNFGFKINRINPLLVIISSKLPAITNVIYKLLWVLQTFQTTIKQCKVPHLKSTDLNRIQVTTLTCCSITKQHSCTMLAIATGNCDVTNVTYNENKCYVVT